MNCPHAIHLRWIRRQTINQCVNYDNTVHKDKRTRCMVIVLEGIQVVDKYDRTRLIGTELKDIAIDIHLLWYWAPLTLILDSVKRTGVCLFFAPSSPGNSLRTCVRPCD